jgi:hypothetical protein
MAATVSSIPKKTILALIIAYCIDYIFFTVVSILTFPQDTLLSIYFWEWVFDNSLNQLINTLPAVHVTAIVVLFSFFFRLSGASFLLIRNLIIVFLLSTLLYTVLAEIVQPGFYRREEKRAALTELARDFEQTAQQRYKNDDFREAKRFLDYYLQIDSTSAEMNELKASVEEQLQDEIRQQQEQKSGQPVVNREYTPEEMVTLARNYYESEDFYSAHYYATLAYQINNALEEAQQVAESAWEKIQERGNNKRTREETLLYNRKQSGYTELLHGDPVKAYYIFKSLARDYPRDPDVQKYLSESRKKLQNVAFFRKEIEEAIPTAGHAHIGFINTTDASVREFVYIDRYTVTRSGTYFFETEVLGLKKDGSKAYHYRAPYGSLLEGKISFLCLEENQEVYYKPSSLLAEKSTGAPTQLALSPSVSHLSLFQVEENFAELGLPQLWGLDEVFEQHGFPSLPVRTEFLFRLVVIFSFFVLSLFALAIGVSLKTTERKTPVLAFLFVPLFPFAIHRIITFYFYLNRNLVHFLLLGTPLLTTLIVLLLIQVVLITIALAITVKKTLY